MRRIRLALLFFLLCPAGTARSEDSPEVPRAEVTHAERDRALLGAMRFLDKNRRQRDAPLSPPGAFANAVAGWAYLLASDRGGRRLPPRRSVLGHVSRSLAHYVERVDRVLEQRSGKEQRIGEEGWTGSGTECSPSYCWPIAMAALFFSETVARNLARREARPSLTRIIRILERAQQENGGWGHDGGEWTGGRPVPIPDPTGRRASLTYPMTLFSTTNLAAPALAIARRTLGLEPGESVARARTYYETFQSTSGSLPYEPSQKAFGDLWGEMPEGTAEPTDIRAPFVARTAGGVFALLGLGAGLDDPVLRHAIEYVGDDVRWVSEGHGSATYGLLLAALAYRARGDAAWALFRSTFFRRLLEVQKESGAFRCVCRNSSSATTCDFDRLGGGPLLGSEKDTAFYVTAIHTFVLMLDRTRPRVLPNPPVTRRPARIEPQK